MWRFVKAHRFMFAMASVTLAAVAFVAIGLMIGAGVRGAVAEAQARHPGEPIAALMAVASADDLAPAVRNRAIWALGQLGRSEAVPMLQSLVAPGPCDHDSSVCRYEVEKAIAACSGTRNIGAVVWRHGDLAIARIQ